MISLLTDRIVEYAWACYQGDLETVRQGIVLFGGTITLQEEFSLHFRGPGGIAGAVLTGKEPITPAVVLALTLLGMRWLEIVPDLAKRVEHRWKAERKKKD